MFETDRALVQFQSVVQMTPAEPHDGLARAHLLLGAAHDRLGSRCHGRRGVQRRHQARAVVDASDIRSRARAALGRRLDATVTAAYRLSIEGLRALERGDGNRAVSLLARAVSLTPDDPVATYRYSIALQSIGDATRARSMRERVIQARPAAPAIVLASACVDAAAISERDGERQRAIALYQRALDTVGGAPRAYEDARLGLKRLAP